MSTPLPLLEAVGIRKQFPGVLALDGVSIRLERGEVLAVVGENGAGKSTLMKVLAGVYRPDAGEVRLAGQSVHFDSPAAAIAAGVSLIHQELNLAENLSVADNFFLGRERTFAGPLRLLDRAAMRKRADDLLERVGLPHSYRDSPVGSLAPGQKQLVEIARALGLDARVIIMDEPTSSLSQKETDRLYEVIDALRAAGVAVLYISHRLAEVKRCADRAVVLRDGRNAGEVARAQITHDNLVRLMVGRDLTRFFHSNRSRRPVGQAASLPVIVGQAASLPVGLGQAETLPHDWERSRPVGQAASLPVGLGKAETLPHGQASSLPHVRGQAASLPHVRGQASSLPHEKGAVVLGLDGVRYTDGPPHPVSLSVRAGEVLGMAGLVGAGRTELAEAVFGLRPLVAGTIQVNGQPVSIHSPADAIDRGVLLVPEDRRRHGLVLEQSVGFNLSLPNLAALSSARLVSARREAEMNRKMIDRLRVKTPSPRQPVGLLSGGNQQKVVFGKWLARGPRVLILDEPTRGVDVGAKAEIYALIDDLAGQGVAVWMISSDMEELLGVSDRVVVMHEGRLAGELTRDQLTEEAVMRLATGGGA